ncbi:hypothetical protein MmTuc01_0797 [Methanosarcina mazei Tuc01]|uniref:Uncharacterized protein n=1 Tax=Methanosarcina mazei Tuc01 TaxID=1236903 RepID=M1Q7P8_METMZ|nr:hypothetical protein MmTuc01_0797 [Methanosarcina mazei Tuc01]
MNTTFYKSYVTFRAFLKLASCIFQKKLSCLLKDPLFNLKFNLTGAKHGSYGNI